MTKVLRQIKDKILRLFMLFRQFIQFGIVGIANTTISYITYRIVLWIFQQFPQGYTSTESLVYFFFRWDYMVANTLAFILSVLNAYLLNRLWVFKKEANKAAGGTLIKFLTSYGITFGISLLLAFFWTDLWHLPKEYAPLFTMPVTVPINFLLNKYFTFAANKKMKTEILEA